MKQSAKKLTAEEVPLSVNRLFDGMSCASEIELLVSKIVELGKQAVVRKELQLNADDPIDTKQRVLRALTRVSEMYIPDSRGQAVRLLSRPSHLAGIHKVLEARKIVKTYAETERYINDVIKDSPLKGIIKCRANDIGKACNTAEIEFWSFEQIMRDSSSARLRYHYHIMYNFNRFLDEI